MIYVSLPAGFGEAAEREKLCCVGQDPQLHEEHYL